MKRSDDWSVLLMIDTITLKWYLGLAYNCELDKIILFSHCLWINRTNYYYPSCFLMWSRIIMEVLVVKVLITFAITDTLSKKSNFYCAKNMLSYWNLVYVYILQKSVIYWNALLPWHKKRMTSCILMYVVKGRLHNLILGVLQLWLLTYCVWLFIMLA